MLQPILLTISLGLITFSNGSKQLEFRFDSLERTSGTSTDGNYQHSLVVPQFQEPGTYVLSRVQLDDVIGNYRGFEQTGDVNNPNDISHAGGSFSFEVISSTTDSLPPVMTSSVGTPHAVNINAGAGAVTITANFTDDLSGFDHGYFTFSNGSKELQFRFDSLDRISGTSTSGSYQQSLVVPRFQEAGTYVLSRVQLDDVIGNNNDFEETGDTGNSNDISHAGGTFSFVVTDSVVAVMPSPPKAVFFGKRVVVTTKSKLKIKGSTTGAVSGIKYRVGKGPWLKFSTSSSWKISAQLSLGRNVITVIAQGDMGDSPPLKITVVRKNR